jgi:oxygen-independent coproporphyrinogen-3 oxidase
MHRTHRAEQVAPAIAALRAAGIDNVSVDLIFALPAELRRDWASDLEQTLALAPTHVSLYGLTIEPHTPLARWTERGTTVAAPDEHYADEYLLAHSLLGAAGFTFYELSNAALAGRRSRHNSAYWSGAAYLGLGPSAHSLVDGVRRWNVRDWADYQRRAAVGASLVAGEEVLDSEARRLETLYLGLRTDAGIAASLLAPDLIAGWVEAGWAVLAGDRLTLTVEGWLRLDALVAAARDS